MRADKKKWLSKVAKAVLEKPLATQEELAQMTWLSTGNVSNKMRELEATAGKDPKIIAITDRDLYNLERMQQRVLEKIESDEEMSKTRLWELAQAMREATARYSLFRWTATDKNGWLNLPIPIIPLDL